MMRIIRTKNDDGWEYIKSHFPIIHIYKNIYLVRQYTYEHHRISKWIIVIVESEDKTN